MSVIKECVIVPIKDVKHHYVSVYDNFVSAGFPSPAEDFTELPLSLDEKYLSNPASTFLVKVVGHSMFPTLLPNDLLIVKSDKAIQHNEIGIISVNNTDFTVKRFDKKKSRLIADNKSYSDISVKENDTLICLGVVRQIVRDL